MRAKSGFTLVEILIVVVILGILAAIVIPQFTGASTEAKESSLKSDLHSMRSQISLYKIRNNDTDPNALSDLVSDYIRAIPVNPFNNLSTVGNGTTVGNNDNGWEYTSSTGEVQADDSAAHAAW